MPKSTPPISVEPDRLPSANGVPDAVELTRRLIGFKTVNPPGEEEPCARYLAGLLEAAGFTVTVQKMSEGRANLVATLGVSPGGPLPIGFTGHIDTVPLGAMAWSQDPFAGDIVDGKLYGRGASDMKAGVAAFVAAAIAEADRLRQGPGVVLVLTAGEETGCAGALALTQGGVLPQVGALVVAEPTANRLFDGHKGVLWLSAVSSGKTAHGSMPERGVNALYKAARVVTRLEHYDFGVPGHPVLGSPTLNVGTMSGGMNINSVPDRAEITIDIRTIPGQEHARLRDSVSDYVGEDAAVAPLIDLPGIWSDPGLPWMGRLADLVEKETGLPQKPEAATYFTDASVLTPALGGAPTAILGPGEPGMAHQTDEWCEVRRIEEAVRLYRAIIADWTGRDS